MSAANTQPTVVRTERGLSIRGTRITLYQIMDYVKAGASPELIRDDFYLTIRQTDDILNYIKSNYDEVEAEYQKIISDAEEIRKYWTERNKERFKKIAGLPRKPEYELIRAKLRERRLKEISGDNAVG